MTQPDTPRTAAGRALLERCLNLIGAVDGRDVYHFGEAILAIEAEAAAGTALDVERLWRVLSGWGVIENGTWVSFQHEDAEQIAAAYNDEPVRKIDTDSYGHPLCAECGRPGYGNPPKHFDLRVTRHAFVARLATLPEPEAQP